MNSAQGVLFYGAIAAALLIVGSFIAWFQVRNTPSGDAITFGLATLGQIVLVILGTSDSSLRVCLGPVIVVPGTLIYLWFAGLWSSRRTQASLHQWARRHGYHITSLSATVGYPMDSWGNPATYRIIARHVQDGRIRAGWVWDGTRILSSGPAAERFRVLWEGDIPIHGPGVHPARPGHPHLGHGHPPAAGSRAPANPPAGSPALESLSEREREVIRSSIAAILHGPFLGEAEFHTRTGCDREEVRRFLQSWPRGDESEARSDSSQIIRACLNEVSNGVTFSPEQWREWFGPEVTQETVRNVLAKWTQAQEGGRSGSK